MTILPYDGRACERHGPFPLTARVLACLGSARPALCASSCPLLFCSVPLRGGVALRVTAPIVTPRGSRLRCLRNEVQQQLQQQGCRQNGAATSSLVIYSVVRWRLALHAASFKLAFACKSRVAISFKINVLTGSGSGYFIIYFFTVDLKWSFSFHARKSCAQAN